MQQETLTQHPDPLILMLSQLPKFRIIPPKRVGGFRDIGASATLPASGLGSWLYLATEPRALAGIMNFTSLDVGITTVVVPSGEFSVGNEGF